MTTILPSLQRKMSSSAASAFCSQASLKLATVFSGASNDAPRCPTISTFGGAAAITSGAASVVMTSVSVRVTWNSGLGLGESFVFLSPGRRASPGVWCKIGEVIEELRMSDADLFLDAIFDNPEDDTPRLVYADWLEEHGQAH